MAKKNKWHDAYINNATYMMYYNRLRDYALSMFEWTGLPDTVNKRFLELKMYEEGKILFLHDNDLGYLAMPFTYGELNHYNEPVIFHAVSINYNKSFTVDNAVPIWNNYARQPIDPIIRQYAYRLYEITRTQDVNVRAQKTPVLILTEDGQRLTLENVYQQFDGNKPVIFGHKSGFDKESVTVLKTDAPYVSDKLQVLKNDIWNECMTFLGVGNAKQDKKERLVSDEVAANDEQIKMAREVMLKSRQNACEQINQMFGLNVWVDYKLNVLEKENGSNRDEGGR